MEEKIFNAALAGLLHDIGKFALRAGERGTRQWDNEGKRDFGYYHALLTSDFIEQYVPKQWKEAVKNTASSHHRPVHRLDWVLSLADHLSAGERADPEADDRAVQPQQLLSIFSSLTADDQTVGDAYLPLAALELNHDAIFPAAAWTKTQVERAYGKLWTNFCQDARQLKETSEAWDDPAGYLEGLQFVLQRYTWSIPSAYYKNRPDISLFDHSRMTAALAAIMSTADTSDQELASFSQKPEGATAPLVLLVGGDLSGLQDFIYTISSRGATPALRGRSFYLQLLTDALVRFILRKLDLPAANLIYSGGGNFYLLARPSDAEQLKEIQQQISRILYRQHQGDLYLAMASVPLVGKDFFEGRISASWSGLHDRLSQSKHQRFAELGDDLKKVFEPQGHGGNEEKQCQVCGREHSETRGRDKSSENPEGVRKCPACVSFEELGDALRKAEYLVWEDLPTTSEERDKENQEPGSWQDTLHALGYHAQVLSDLPGDSPSSRLVLALNDASMRKLKPLPHTIMGRQFLVNVTPTITQAEIQILRENRVADLPREDSVKPFHVMEAQSDGIKRLAVLRMDVDNLGLMFSNGLGKKYATLSRIAHLSFAVKLYFEGWVGCLAENLNQLDSARGAEYGERLYSIYSGGDDLFFVGSWDAVIELGREVRAGLTDYAAGHPGVHACAGVVLVGGKYPLAQAAEESKQALDEAKHLAWREKENTHKKDAICFLGKSISWQKFGLENCEKESISNAHALMHLLIKMDPKVVNSLVRRLVLLSEQYNESQEKSKRQGKDLNRLGQQQVVWGPWHWRGYYTLRRLAKQNENDQVKKLAELLKTDNFTSMEWIGLAARWAELKLR